jgi:hypothetical protein
LSSTVQFISIAIIVLTLVTTLILTQIIRRRREVALRVMDTYEALPLMIGESIESDRPMHVSFGSAGVGGSNTILALATAEFFYQVAQQIAIGAVPPIATVSETSALPLAYGTLNRAYRSRNRLDRAEFNSVRWYPSGTQSLAFAAALTATIADERVSGNVLIGEFGPELALVLDAAARRNQRTIAGSVLLEGQAVAYAMSERTLIGEELFTADAYMSEGAAPKASLITLDVLRYLLILFILIPMIDALIKTFSEGR